MMLSIAAEIKKLDDLAELRRRYQEEEHRKSAEAAESHSCQDGSCGCCSYCTGTGY
jgi:hypothetical protein